jgi:hypothetical protein
MNQQALGATRRIITEPQARVLQNVGQIWGNLLQAKHEKLESPFSACKWQLLATCLDNASTGHYHLRTAEQTFPGLKAAYPTHERHYINCLEKGIGRVRKTFLDTTPKANQSKRGTNDELCAERFDLGRQYLESEADDEMGESDEESREEDAMDDWKAENWRDIPGVHDLQ